MASGETTRLGLPYPVGADAFALTSDLQALAEALDSIAPITGGTLANRPVSTPGSPGTLGRFYYTNDQSPNYLFMDTGTGWVAIGPTNPTLLINSSIPGELKAWPGDTLPDPAKYWTWVWADGKDYDIASYPEAAANIDSAWDTHNGKAAPAAGKFRVPDMRGATPVGPDQMPGGTMGQANRILRTGRSTIAAVYGEENHALSSAELAAHTHTAGSFAADSGGSHQHSVSGTSNSVQPTVHVGAHAHGVNDPTHIHGWDISAGYGDHVALTYGGETLAYAIGGQYPKKITGEATMAYASTGISIQSATPSGSQDAHSHTVTGTAATAGAHGHTISGSSGSSGSGTVHNNMQPSNVVPWIVRLDG